jgi:hypothetical protein
MRWKARCSAEYRPCFVFAARRRAGRPQFSGRCSAHRASGSAVCRAMPGTDRVCRVACGHRIVVQWTGHRNDSGSLAERWNPYVVSSVILAIRSYDHAAAHGVLRLPPTIHSMIWTMPTIVNATALMAPTDCRYGSYAGLAILATISNRSIPSTPPTLSPPMLEGVLERRPYVPFVPRPRSQVRVAATRARTAIMRICESPA